MEEVCVPQITFLNGGTLEGCWWQQDGASIHTRNDTLDLLAQAFDGHVLGLKADQNNRGGVEWAPRSPDMANMVTSVWPIMKYRVFHIHPVPHTIDQLEQKVYNVVADMQQNEPELIQRIILG